MVVFLLILIAGILIFAFPDAFFEVLRLAVGVAVLVAIVGAVVIAFLWAYNYDMAHKFDHKTPPLELWLATLTETELAIFWALFFLGVVGLFVFMFWHARRKKAFLKNFQDVRKAEEAAEKALIEEAQKRAQKREEEAERVRQQWAEEAKRRRERV